MPDVDPSNLETVSSCELCGSTPSSVYVQTRDHLYGTPGDLTFWRCQNCGLIYLSPRPSPAEIGAYYPDLDYHAFQAANGPKARVLRWLRQREAQTLMKGLTNSAQVLEIGCGTGDLLVHIAKAGGGVMGIEPNPAAAQAARGRYGLNVHTGTLDDVELPANTFDRILMRYALEHVHHPLATVKKIAALLKPNGEFWFWIPNAASWDARLFGAYWRGLDAPRHLFIFTPSTAKQLVEAVGLHVRRIMYSGVPNDWVGSTEAWLRDRGQIGLTRFIGMSNPLALAAALPFSLLAAQLQQAGRMSIIARR